MGSIRPVSSASGMNRSGLTRLPPWLDPADQRLGTDAAAALQVDNRLVIDLELVLLQALLQFTLQGKTTMEQAQHEKDENDRCRRTDRAQDQGQLDPVAQDPGIRGRGHGIDIREAVQFHGEQRAFDAVAEAGPELGGTITALLLRLHHFHLRHIAVPGKRVGIIPAQQHGKTVFTEIGSHAADQHAGMNQRTDLDRVLPLAQRDQTRALHQPDFHRADQAEAVDRLRDIRRNRRHHGPPAGADQLAVRPHDAHFADLRDVVGHGIHGADILGGTVVADIGERNQPPVDLLQHGGRLGSNGL